MLVYCSTSNTAGRADQHFTVLEFFSCTYKMRNLTTVSSCVWNGIAYLVNSVSLHSKLATKPFHQIHLGAMLRKFGLIFVSNSWLKTNGKFRNSQQFYTVLHRKHCTMWISEDKLCYKSASLPVLLLKLTSLEMATLLRGLWDHHHATNTAQAMKCQETVWQQWRYFIKPALNSSFLLQKHKNDKQERYRILTVFMQNLT